MPANGIDGGTRFGADHLVKRIIWKGRIYLYISEVSFFNQLSTQDNLHPSCHCTIHVNNIAVA